LQLLFLTDLICPLGSVKVDIAPLASASVVSIPATGADSVTPPAKKPKIEDVLIEDVPPPVVQPPAPASGVSSPATPVPDASPAKKPKIVDAPNIEVAPPEDQQTNWHPKSLSNLSKRQKIAALAAIALLISTHTTVCTRFLGASQKFQPKFFCSLPMSVVHGLDVFFHFNATQDCYYRWEGSQVRCIVIPLPEDLRKVLVPWFVTNNVPYTEDHFIAQLVLRTASQTKHKDNGAIKQLWVCNLQYPGSPLGNGGMLQYQVIIRKNHTE
jgi:hypothetical protein